MPIYEFVCNNCAKKLSFLVLNRNEFAPKCNRCESTNLRRVMSRFGTVRSEEDRLESLANPSKWGDLDENDPKSMVKFMKKMGREMGEDYDQLIAEAEEEAAKSETEKTESDDEQI